MQGIRGLLYILIALFIAFTLTISLLEWSEIKRLRYNQTQTERDIAITLTRLVRDSISEDTIQEEYRLFELAKRYQIRRIVIFGEDASIINDTLGGASVKDLPKKEDIASAIKGNDVFIPTEQGEKRTGRVITRLNIGGRPYALFLEIGLGVVEDSHIGTITTIFVGATILAIFLYVALMSYMREQKRQLATGGEPSEVGFVVDTFHELVTKLKAKEKELETLRGLAEERAEAIEGYNENILQSVASGVLSTDESGRITKINSAGERILGVRMKDISGKELSEVFSGELLDLLLRERNIERGEIQCTAPSGRRLWLGFSLTSLLDKKKTPIGRLFVFSDLTELKALEAQAELRQRLSSLGEMAAGIAHELRNPMAVISGYAKLLSRQLEGPHLKTIEAISKEVSTMDKIINDFLSFARPGEPRKSDTELSELISEVIRDVVGKRADITIQTDIESPLTIEGDPVLLRQAFANLIQNSIEAMPDGGEIKILGRKKENAVNILISDTGHGIPPSIEDKVFLPFFTTKERGTGLGLAIVHRTIAQHGGLIEVIRQQRGAGFNIVLPAKRANYPTS